MIVQNILRLALAIILMLIAMLSVVNGDWIIFFIVFIVSVFTSLIDQDGEN